MLREELYEKVMEISNKYGLPVRINKKTKKKELQEMYDNMLKLHTGGDLIEKDDFLMDFINDYEEDSNYKDLSNDDEEYEVEIEPDNDNAMEEDNDNAMEEEKKTNRKIKSTRMKKLLKQSINMLKKDVNTIISNYNKETDQLLKSIEGINDLTDGEIEIVITNYNEIREDAENEINLAIETYEGEIPDSFYIWVETQLNRKKRQIEKTIN